MSINPIAALRSIVLSGGVTLPEGESVEDIIERLNFFESEDENEDTNQEEEDVESDI